MAFGAFAMLPLRLGGNELTGWTAAQFMRVTSDLAACRRTLPSAFFLVDKSGSTVTITNYFGENGNGSVSAPVATVNGTGDVTLRFTPPVWTSELDVQVPIVIRGGMTSCSTATHGASLQVIDHATVRLRTFNLPGGGAADGAALVELWFDHQPRIGDYGGSTDKTDSETEGTTPRAASIYREIQAMRGGAYRQERDGYVHVENLALARHLAWIWYRFPEEAVNNQTPARADALLAYWVKVLGVPNRPGDQKWEIRQRCAVKYKRLQGSSRSDIDEAFAEQMGADLVGIVRNLGNPLSSPPDFTYWPIVNPGTGDTDLGGGTWLSHRSHLFFVISRGLLAEPDRFHRTVNGALFSLADSILPAWCTFSWYLDGSGFIIEESLLSYDAV